MHTYGFSLFTLSTNVIIKGAIDCLKWGREAKLVSELNNELNGACGMKKQMVWCGKEVKEALRDT